MIQKSKEKNTKAPKKPQKGQKGMEFNSKEEHELKDNLSEINPQEMGNKFDPNFNDKIQTKQHSVEHEPVKPDTK